MDNEMNSRNPFDRGSDDSDFSETLSSFSSNLSSNSSSLDSNTRGLNRNSGSLDKNTEALLKVVQEFKRVVGEFGDDVDRIEESSERSQSNTQQNLADMQSVYERSGRNLDTMLNKGQIKISKTLTSIIDIFEVVGKRLIGEFTNAADRVSDKYKEKFNDITVRMQWTQAEYSSKFNEYSARFQKEGLNKTFSPVDYADALAEAVSIGLRGDEAERQAYRNLITNKLIPAISTNTVAYRRMSKTFGDAFNENMVAVSKYTEALYGAEGLEDGKANAALEAIEKRLRYEESVGNLAEGQAEETFNKVLTAVNLVESNGGNSDEMVMSLKKLLEGNIMDASAFDMTAWGYTGDSTEFLGNLLKGETWKRYLETSSGSGTSIETQQIMVDAMGGSKDAIMDAAIAMNNMQKQGIDIAEAINGMSNFDYSREYKKQTDKLEDGVYSTADQIVNKMEENAATSFGVAKSEIARFDEIASDVKTIAGILLSMAADRVLGRLFGGDSSSGLTGRLLGGRVASLSNNIGEAAQLYNMGENFTSISSAYGRGTAALGKVASFGGANSLAGGLTNLAAGPGAIIAGAVMMGKDALEGGFKARDEGASNEEVFLQSLRGAFTGGKIDSEEEKSSKISNALQGKGVDFDWGAMGGNALKGGLVGAGVGTAVGGWAAGIGTAVGAVAGGVVGAISNAIDQAIENAQYNKLAESVNNFETSLNKADDAILEYKEALNNSEELEKKLQILSKDSAASEAVQLRTLESLKQQFPSLLGNVDEVTDLTDSQIEMMKRQIEQEKKDAAWKASQGVNEALKGADQVITDTQSLNIMKDPTKGDLDSTTTDILNHLLSDATDSENFLKSPEREDYKADYEESKARINKSIVEGAAARGQSEEEYVDYLNSVAGGSYYTKSEDGGWRFVNIGEYEGISHQDALDDFGKYATKYDDSGKNLETSSEERESIQEASDNAYTKLRDAVSEFDQYAGVAVDEDGNYLGDSRQLESDKSSIDKIIELAKNYNELMINSGFVDSQLHSDNSTFSQVASIAETIGHPFSFKVGAYNISRDGTPAILHEGEMVLTAANAEKLRNIGSGGISGFLDSLTALESNMVAATPSGVSTGSLASTAVTAAIQNQTESIVNVLNSILTAVLQIKPSLSSSTPSTLSRSLLSFES